MLLLCDGVGESNWGSSKRKEFPGGCWFFFESMCLGEHKFGETVLGDTVDTAPLGFFLHYLFWELLSIW